MGVRGPVSAVVGIVLLANIAPVLGQGFEASGVGGYGMAERTGFGYPGVPSGGAAVAWAYSSRSKLQFDYVFGRCSLTASTTAGISSPEAT